MNIQKLALLFSSFVLLASMTACGTDPDADLPTESTTAIAGSSDYIVNSDTTFQNVPAVSGLMMKATTPGGTDAVAAFAIEKNSARELATTDEGYVTQEELHAIIELISAETYIDGNISTINEQVFTKYTEFTVGDYSFTTPAATTTVDLSNQIVNTLAATTEVLPAGSGITSDEFRMFVTVTSFNSEYYYTVSISPKAEAIFQENFALMTELSSGTNFTKGVNDRVVSKRDSFVGIAATSNKADFLFMIDDSGSMGDNQAALSVAATDFEAAINLAGMDYNIAILTTGGGADGEVVDANVSYDRVVQNVGIIDNNMTLFKEQIDLVGASGSPVETGIYNSEQALTSGGILNSGSFELSRESTQMSVVILSDEVSQYTSRAANSFNPNNNIFVSENILVNSIVDIGLCGDMSFYGPGEDTNGQYDDLSIATGGLVGNICNGGATPNFSAVMQNIVFQAAGVYHLEHRYVKPNSIEVSVDGVSIPSSIADGYMYVEGTNSIAFFGTLPDEGADIEIYYEYPKDLNVFAND